MATGLSGLFPQYQGPDLSTLPGPSIPRVRHAPLPGEQSAALANPFDPFDKVQHAARMNQWLLSTLDQQNAAKIRTYMLGYMDWKVNAELYLSCRPPIQPPPPPAPPALVDVVPKSVEFWFGLAAE